jgi:hypothetical protein
MAQVQGVGMSDLIPGGKSDKIPPSAFPAKKVQEGAKVESEHTSNKTVAKEIARDHLSEDMGYYGKLKKMEKKAFLGFGVEVAHKGRWGLNLGFPHLVAGTYRLGEDDQEWAPHVGLGLTGAQLGLSYRSQHKKPKHKEKKAVSLARAEDVAKKMPIESIGRNADKAWQSAANIAKDGRESSKLIQLGNRLHELSGRTPHLKTVLAEWDQGTLQMPERTFDPKIPNQDPWNRKSKKKVANAMFDELIKISFDISRKGALIGGAIGTGVGTLSAVKNELQERSWDDRFRLNDEEKSKLRKKRLKLHAGRVLAYGGAGATAGAGFNAAKKFTARTAKDLADEAGAAGADAAIDRTKQRIANFFRRKKK